MTGRGEPEERYGSDAHGRAVDSDDRSDHTLKQRKSFLPELFD